MSDGGWLAFWGLMFMFFISNLVWISVLKSALVN